MYSCDDDVVKIKNEPLDSTDDALSTPNYGDFVKDHFAASDSLFDDANGNDFPLLQPKEEPPDTDYDPLPSLSNSLPPMSSIIKLEKEDEEPNVWPFSPLAGSAMVSIPNLLLSEPSDPDPSPSPPPPPPSPLPSSEKQDIKLEKEEKKEESSPQPKQDHKLVCSQCNAQYSTVKEFVKHYRSHKEEEQQVSDASDSQFLTVNANLIVVVATQEQDKDKTAEQKKSGGKKIARRKASERACRVCGAEFQSFNELVNHFLTHYNLSLNNASPKQVRTLRLKEIIPMSPLNQQQGQEVTPKKDSDKRETASSSSRSQIKRAVDMHLPPLKKVKQEKLAPPPTCDALRDFEIETSRTLLKPMFSDPVSPTAVAAKPVASKSPVAKPAKKHICTICGMEFATMSPLVAHFLTHRNLKLNQKPTPPPPPPVIYSCNVCNYQCSAASRLRQHQETHIDQPQVHCPTCNKAFRTQRLLDQHITRQHVKIECKECGQTFLKRNDMVEHYLKHFDLTLKKQQ